MEYVKLPFQMEEKKVLNDLLENLNIVLKDSDAVAEKDIVKQFLREISDVTTITVLGSKGVGKTCLLTSIFHESLGSNLPTQEICEYRYGAKENVFPLDTKITRYFKTLESLQGIAVVDMPGCNAWKKLEISKNAIGYLNQSELIIVVFSADSVNVYDVWDILEQIDNKKIVFVLNKTDCVSEKLLNEAELRLRQYMFEAGIQAPIFKVSAINAKIGKREECCIGELCHYINTNIIGKNPILSKQRENMLLIKNMIKEIESSFQQRQRQLEIDKMVIANINQAMDGFYDKSKQKIEYLKKEIENEIDKEIDGYKDEIVKRLNPTQIKERFPNGMDDFKEYLELVNVNYQKRMTLEIEKRTQSCIRTYLSELQDVYTEAIGFFEMRESLLSLEDKFYGSLAESKRCMVSAASYQLDESKRYYCSLTNASEELFQKIWSERVRNDRRISFSSGTGVVIGGTGVGTGGAVLFTAAEKSLTSILANTIGVSAGTAGATAGSVGATTGTAVGGAVAGISLATAIGFIIGAGIGGVVLYNLFKKITTAISIEEMQKVVDEYIEEFYAEVDLTKQEMKEQILFAVDEIFNQELNSADKTFIDFRMSVNIDSKNIPLLEDRVEKLHGLMHQIERIEKEQEMIC